MLYTIDNGIYNGGDGKDTEVLNYLHVDQAQQSFSSYLDQVSTTIAIIDSGIDIAVWQNLESRFGVDIDFVAYKQMSDGTIVGGFDFINHHTSLNYYDASSQYINDSVADKHGSMVASILAQIAPHSHIIAIQAAGVVGSPTTALQNKIFDDIYRYRTDINIISDSNSFCDTYNNGNCIGETPLPVQKLADRGVLIFKSTEQCYDGNTCTGTPYYHTPDLLWSDNNNDYYDLIGVGAVFDKTIDKNGNAHLGQRVDYDTTGLYPLRGEYYSKWESKYSDIMSFVAPGFDIEIVYQSPTDGSLRVGIADGTSFSTPIMAGLAALVWDVFNQRGFDLTSFAITGPVMQALQYSTHTSWTTGIGYGVPNVYDAINWAINW